MRPFGCPVTISNTLDPLGKFQGKVDEGFLVRYSVCSKAFRVFNSRTHIVQETLHVNFMENKPNVAGSGLAWLFDIDSLSQTMNYHSVLAENQTNSNVDAHTDEKEHDDDIQKSMSLDIHSSSCGDQTREQGDKAENKDKDDVGAEADINNMESIISVSSIQTSRIHKDHPTSQIIGKFQGNVDEGFLVGYSVCSKAFRVFNSRTRIVQETLHVNFIENKSNVAGSGPAWLFDIDSLCKTMNYHLVLAENQINSNVGDKVVNKDKGKNPVVTITGFRDLNEEFAECIDTINKEVNVAGSSVSTVELNFTNNTNDFSAAGPTNATMPNLEDLSHSADDVGAEADINNMESIISVSPIPTFRIYKDHPTSQSIGDLSSTTQTRSMARGVRDQEEPKRVHQALKDPSWIKAMQEELLQFNMQKVWILVDLPYGKRAIGTKWVYRNKKDKRGIVIRNKPRLVAQGHTQEEGIDYKEVFALVARIEAIRLFLAYASFMGFPVYQMDVKSAFLYGTIEEEVYVCQPPGFEDPQHPDKVYKVVKALYGLHQASRA
nr:hypothetical protein [Tanacetum cinerariifolium]